MDDTLEVLEQPQHQLLTGVYATITGDSTDLEAAPAVAARLSDKMESAGVETASSTVRSAGEHPNAYLVNAIVGVLFVLGLMVVFLSGFLITNTLQALLNQQIRADWYYENRRRAQDADRRRLCDADPGLWPAGICGRRATLVPALLPPAGPDGRAAQLHLAGRADLLAVIAPAGWAGVDHAAAGGLAAHLEGHAHQRAGGTQRRRPTPSTTNRPPKGQADKHSSRRPGSAFSVQFTSPPVPRLASPPPAALPATAPAPDHRLRNTFRRKGRLVLTLFTLTLGGAVFIATFNVQVSLGNYIDQIGQYFLSDVNVSLDRPYRTERSHGCSRMFREWARWKAGRRGGRADPGRWLARRSGQLLAPPAGSRLVKPVMIAGRWIEPLDENAIVLSELFPF